MSGDTNDDKREISLLRTTATRELSSVTREHLAEDSLAAMSLPINFDSFVLRLSCLRVNLVES